MDSGVIFSVFTKPWPRLPCDELGSFIAGLGFDGIEFPLRPGYQVEPQDAEKNLPQFARRLREHGVTITSVASTTDERVFAACQAAGVPIIRIMADFDLNRGYLVCEGEKRGEIARLLPFCDKYGVKLAVQHHYGPMVNNSMELRHLVAEFDPSLVGAIWDAAHSALAGEEIEQGLDIVWSHLAMVNLKNAFYLRTNGPEAEQAEWARYFTLGNQGLSSWPRVAEYLKKRQYPGVICLSAEYTQEDQVDSLIAKDIAYARSLFAD